MITLTEMSSLVKMLVDADNEVIKTETRLKVLKENARNLREEAIPSAMQELGLEQLKLDTGQEITIKQDVYASISVKDRPKAFAWLDNNGFGGLIKIDVKVPFGRDEQESAVALCDDLINKGITANLDKKVHPQTLKAFLKEQIAKGENIPLDLFGARPIWTAKIK